MRTPPEDTKSPLPSSASLPRVVLADQSLAVIERLAASISDVAQIVGRATNAGEALHGILNNNPHLTVFDVAITDGIDLLRRIKRHQPPVIVVILTHSADETTRQYCMRLGAAYFLDKIRDFHQVREILIGVAQNWGLGSTDSPSTH